MWPWRPPLRSSSGRLCREPFGFVDRLLDRTDHVEGGLRQVVVLAFDDALEALDRVFDLDLDPGRAGKHGRDVKGLRKKALDLPGARDDQLVLFAEFVHAEDRDDV